MSEPTSNAAARNLPKRFYKLAVAEAVQDDGTSEPQYRVVLDGRPLRTPAKAPLVVPSLALAQAIAAEWGAQGTHIDPALMPLTRITNSTIDGVAHRRREVAQEIASYAANDLVCYRAETPETLAQRQAKAWDPVVAWADAEFETPVRTVTGVMHVAQSPDLARAIEAQLLPLDPLRLAALHVITTLTGSGLLALAHAGGHLSVDDIWSAAHIDEDFQIEHWGTDGEAEARRNLRYHELRAACRILALVP